MTYRISIRTTDGEAVELACRKGETSIAHVAHALAVNYGFPNAVRFMYAGKVLSQDRDILEFPQGTVVVLGKPSSQAVGTSDFAVPPPPPNVFEDTRGHGHHSTHGHHAHPAARPQQSGTDEVSPQRLRMPYSPPEDVTAYGGATPSAGHSSKKGQRGTSPQSQGNGQFNPTSPQPPQHAPAAPQAPQESKMTVNVAAPGVSSHKIPVSIWESATVGDLLTHLVAKDVKFIGAKLVANGKVFDKMELQLKNIGVHDGSTVHCATGEAVRDPKTLLLMQVRADTEALEQEIARKRQEPGGLRDQDKKGWYELAMRLLFSLDNLVELPPDMKANRKEIAHRLQQLQDSLGVSA